jgi:hypothetical protein
MKVAAIVLAVLSLVVGAAAAWLWLKSSLVKYPTPPKPNTLISAAYHQQVSEAMIEASWWNKWAAIATGAAALLGAISSVLGTIAP